MTSPPFSLLLPVYGGDDPDHFRRAFNSSTEQQVLAPDEIVVVQDGPIGRELEQAVRDSVGSTAVPARIVRLPANRGLAAALKAGLEDCHYDVVARMDADDIALPHRFAVQLPLIASGLDLVGAALEEFSQDDDGSLTTGIRRLPPLEHDDISSYARFHSPFNHPTVVFRRAAVERAGGYLDLPLLEDYWLFVRMIQAGARTANAPDVLLRYRVSSGAFRRRGGFGLLRSEWTLQLWMRASGFTTPVQCARNIIVRGGYRLVPEVVRKTVYRHVRRRNGGML